MIKGREQLINKFVIKVFKGKSKGVSKQFLSNLLKKWLKANNMPWTLEFQQLFEVYSIVSYGKILTVQKLT